MRPLKLQIEGLASFREPQEIDFSQFGLFVITGPTGSGKTTILDAMSLALYGKAPRTDGSSDRQLVSLGLRRANVSFEFELDGEHYRVVRVVPAADATGSTRLQIEQRENGEWVARAADGGVRQADEWLRGKLGIDFDAFKKAVVLPQGRFAEFLQGAAADRRKILVELLDLHRYVAAGQKARNKAGEHRAKVAGAEQRLAEDYAFATPEALKAAEAAAEAAAGRLAALTAAVAKGRTLAEQAARAAQEEHQVVAVSSDLAGAAKGLAELAAKWAALRPAAEAADARAADTEAAAKAAREAEEAARTALADTEGRTGSRTALAEWAAAQKAAAEATGDVALHEREIEQLAGRIAELAELAELARLAAEQAQVEADNARTLQQQAQATLQATLSLAEAAKAREKAKTTLRDAETALEDAQKAAHEAEAEAKKRAEAAEEAERVAHELRHSLYAVSLRRELKAGEPCPVCEQAVAKVPKGGDAAGQQIAGAETAAAEARKAAEATRQAAQEAATVVAGARAGRDAAAKDLEQHVGAPTIAEARGQWEAAKAAAQLADRAVAQAEDNRRKKDAERAAADQAHNGAQVEQRGRDQQRADAENRRGAALTTLQGAFPDGPPADPGAALAARAAELDAAEQALQAARNAAADAGRAAEAARAARDVVQRERGALEQGAAAAWALLTARGADLARLATEEAPPAPADTPELDRRLEAAGKWAAALSAAAAAALTRLRESVARLADALRAHAGAAEVPADGLEPSACLAALADAEQEAARADERAGALVTQIRDAIEKAADIRAGVEDDRVLAQRYGFLADHLRSDRFVEFVIGESLQQLALIASQQLRDISGQRYSLSVDGSDFRVVDHANADEERSVATLSGGETFLASLALALALSRGLATLAGHSAAARLDALFIDEGFGTLDPETLEVAVDALERLQEGDRMVGVITHVPLLAERIPTGLRVEPGKNGSRVVAR